MALNDYLGGINEYVGPYQQQVNQAYQGLAQASGDSATLPFKLKEALNQKLNYNQDVIQQKNQALSDYIAAPANARADYQNVWNPFEREKLVANARAQAFAPYATYQDVLGQRMGQVSDIVGQGVAGWQGVVNKAQALAQLAQQSYQNAWNQYTQAASMQSEADQLAQQQSQWEKEFGLSQQKFDWEKSKGTGGGTGIAGVTKADQLTSEVWDNLYSNAQQSYPNDVNAQADYIWSQINANSGALQTQGADVGKLWAWQANLKNAVAQPQTTTSSGGGMFNFAPQPGSPLSQAGQTASPSVKSASTWLDSLLRRIAAPGSVVASGK